VNIGGQVTFLMTMMVIGFSIGGSVIIAQYVGAKKQDKIKETISTLIIMLAAAAVLITATMLIISTPILHLINTPAESFSEARAYLNITIIGVIFVFLYNAMSAIMRGLGDSKTPMLFVSIACGLNIVLDLILVGVFRMAAAGAAYATIISQAVSVVLCVIRLKKYNSLFDFKIHSFKFNTEQFKLLLKIGIPNSIQNVITNISFLFLNSLANSFGVMASAAVGIVGKFNSFAIMPALAISSSISTLSAQNMGARMIERAKKTFYIGLVLSLAISIPIFLISRFFPAQILGLFDDTPEMINAGVLYMESFTYQYLLIPFLFCLNGLITGSGHTLFTAVNNVASALLLRIPLAYLLGIIFDLGIPGIAMSIPLSTFGAIIVLGAYFVSEKWKVNKIIKNIPSIEPEVI
ncbi:MAG: MATE family efflux transporter, partial [Eubacteriales bacterium]|nr:MATE family efflux transporter [Eubacteriales bacterium]